MVWVPYGTHRKQVLHYSATDPRLYWTPIIIYPVSSDKGLRDAINLVLGPVEEPPPDPVVDHVEATHRGIDIWHRVEADVFTAQVAAGYMAAGFTVEECEASIDAILEFLNPPEDPEEGLFAQVVAALKAWMLKNLPDWLLKWGRVINNFITNTTEYINNTYKYITENITNVYNTFREYITEVYNNTYKYITNVSRYITEEITKVYNNTYNYVTNIIGITLENLNKGLADNRAWVTAFFKLMDPKEFLRDPTGFIKAVFTLQRQIAGTSMIESFLEGLEEGLEE